LIGQKISHYSILEKLGEGGMGVVYLAEDLHLKRSVALKVLPADLAGDPERLARFRREAESLAALNHPNIVTIFSIEQVGKLHILTMERVEGRGLDRLLSKEGLPLERLLEIGTALCSALAAAHAKGITHRDLKPENVMLTDDGRLKVLDFGLAKLKGATPSTTSLFESGQSPPGALGGPLPEVTREQAIIGTVPYMSPEQIEGGTVDGRSDLFALGILLYELATGQRPFQGKSPAAVMSAVLEREPRPVTELRGDLPRGLEAILARLLRKNPVERYQTADEVRDDLEALRSGARVSSRLPRSGPSARWIAAAALAVAGGFLVWHGLRTNSGAGARTGIVVMPFENGSAADDEWFAAAMTHGVANRLGAVGDLRVLSPGNAQAWAGKTPSEVGEALGVDYLLYGRVFLVDGQDGRRVVVTPELLRASDGGLLPIDSCDRALPGNDEVLEVQHELANEVVARLGVGTPPDAPAAADAPPTQDTEAYDLYLKGLFFFGKRNQEALAKARACFEQAIARDPGFGLARVALASVSTTLTWYSLLAPKVAYAEARPLIDETLAAQPRLAEAWTMRGSILEHDLRFDECLRAYETALDCAGGPEKGSATMHQWYGGVLTRLGRREEGMREALLARRLDPVSPIITTWVGLQYYWTGNPGEAIRWMDQALELDADFVPGHWHRTWACGMAGRTDDALASAERARALSPQNPLYVVNLAWAHAMAGHGDEARTRLAQVEETARTRYVSNYHVAAVYVALGEPDEAMRHLDRAVEDQADWLSTLNVDARFDALRSDPRFQALLERLGFRR